MYHWQEAMEAEINTLKQNEIQVPIQKKTIECKWVFKTKFNADESLDKYKTRLVAKCYNQIKEIDCTETFASVSRMTTLKILISIVSNKKWHMHLKASLQTVRN